METGASCYNWSLKKLLQSEQNTFERAKAKILYIILLFSLLKAVIAIGVAWHFDRDLQLQRASGMLVLYLIFLKLFLADKKFLKAITHALIWMGLILIWSNIFLFAQTVNLLTLQFIFMLTLSSFYLLEIRFAFLYSILGTLPVLVFLLVRNNTTPGFVSPEQLPSPGYEILAALNFITLILSHYLFRKAFIDNIAEKVALNNQLQLAVKEANQSAESNSEFLSTMSHELRTPLNSVIGITELLLKEPHTAEQEDNLTILKFSASNLHTLINDILDFNKLGSGRLELEAIPVEIDKLFQDISMGLRFQATEKGIDFILDTDTRLSGLRVITDPTRLTQIIYNLGGNAVKFTEKGSVTVRLEALSIKGESVNIRVLIADTGIGISPEKQEAIFEPFTQASSSTTRNFGGTGLGLAIVKRLLLLFNSAISFESKPSAGSTFSFDLELPVAAEPEKPSFVEPDSLQDLSMLRVLVAEDNAMNRILLTKIFSRWHCKPVFAENGREAVDMLSTADFDVVLMDLHMPVMDGYEAAKAIREMPDPVKSGISIIALTASVSANLKEKTDAVGMNGFLLKPFSQNELYARLKAEIPHVS